MALKFIPPKKIGRYALYIEPDFFKVYNDLGSIKSSLPHRMSWDYSQRYNKPTSRNAKILEMVDGEWYTLYDIPAGTKESEFPWKKKRYRVWAHGFTQFFNEKPTHYSDSQITEETVARPMPVEDYVNFRIKVFKEQNGLKADG